MRPVLFVLVILSAALGGCKASTGQLGTGSLKTDLAPNLQDYVVERVAILGSANTTGDTDADAMPLYVTQALRASNKYYFATMEDFESDARRVGLEAEHRTLQRTWESRRIVEPATLDKVLAATNYDAMIAMEVTEWSEYQLHAAQEGTSKTTVGLGIRMFAPDGTCLWYANDLRTVESAPYFPEFNVRASQDGLPRATSQAAVPEPPRIDAVAPVVAADLVETLPEISGPAPESGN